MTVINGINGHHAANGTSTNGVHINGANGTVSTEEGFGTRAIHVGSEPSADTGAVIPSISLSTTFKQYGVGNHKGFEYSRSSNPNRAALEQTLASLESGGAHALAFASGSATTATVIQSLGPNAHIISVNDVYGGTFRYMSRVAKETQGVETTFLDLEDLSTGSAGHQAFIDALTSNTKLIWIETPTNPTLRLIDIKRLSSILDTYYSHSPSSRPIILVDNTFASPYYTSPLLLGADIVLHSLTKYINGHSDVVMGAVILPARHTALLEKLQFLQNAIGAIPSAFDSWLAQRGLKTLHLRMRQHGLNALEVAKSLEKSPFVEEVIYPGFVPALKAGNGKAVERARRRYKIAKKNLSPHAKRWIESLPLPDSDADYDPEYPPFPYSGMISFRIRSSPNASPSELSSLTSSLLSSLRHFTLAESLGGVESLAEVPALMTHASIPPEERAKLGITEALVRLSVGIEDEADLVDDLRQGLENVFGL
ncbi:Cys/Met metabolism PLP-dependent enzyme-domain-containing protein [Rhodocollybia butyracea]|uniref:cystathionine gamma-lyase n=1 Tax=Rhodocollybia butyracea TaxID=206335 RepID=A0A9P5PKZ4_9AGAR|nr:Cys/Met metabolism PLP-dependent enzyme-domain-containing protein [Rhodocollybia butyracea]